MFNEEIVDMIWERETLFTVDNILDIVPLCGGDSREEIS